MPRPSCVRRIVPLTVVVVAWIVGGASSAVAAERCVLIEDFGATWCAPCHTVGDWLAQMQDLYPDTIALLQEHVSSSDAYAIAWGKSRFVSYPITGSIPTTFYDGTFRLVGTDPNEGGGDYDTYLNAYLDRQAVPTDVTLELGAESEDKPPFEHGFAFDGGPTFTFRARVGIPEGAPPRTVWVYIVRALDYYPFPHTYTYYRNCLMEAAATEEVNLVPGERVTVERTMTFDPASWAQKNDIRVLAWVQVPGTSGYREVYQARKIDWPLPPLFPVGDTNCDEILSYADINPFILALQGEPDYHVLYPYCPWLNADCNGDGTVSYADINSFVRLLSMMGQPLQ